QPDENGRVRIRGRENESSSPTFDAKNMQAGINFFSIVIVGTLIPPAGMLIFFALPPIRKDVAQWS
ncbi:MAG TPA: hypothetical protein VG711_06495, partial [Phycisphaerales bacterium]|nr:hypothetical protein [Phycisphaerales bacterium]